MYGSPVVYVYNVCVNFLVVVHHTGTSCATSVPTCGDVDNLFKKKKEDDCRKECVNYVCVHGGGNDFLLRFHATLAALPH